MEVFLGVMGAWGTKARSRGRPRGMQRFLPHLLPKPLAFI